MGSCLIYPSFFLSQDGLGFLGYIAYTWYQKSLFKKILASLIGLATIFIIIVIIVGTIDIRLLIPIVASHTITNEQWEEDLEFLDEALQKHPAYNDSLGGIVSDYRSQIKKAGNPDDH